jgi:hypothetical protein
LLAGRQARRVQQIDHRALPQRSRITSSYSRVTTPVGESL